ncbi:MAG TPA: cysteine methyltransferase [Firmicutes bacterium]|jgi:methylated-DNA-protein-cysteine methyltransferase related protein|nr:cysteine methyltransferase [Bacillota bacterium]
MKKAQFFDDVYEIVAQIPAGKVMTYGQIGLLLGSPHYARQVGQAMFNAPGDLKLPCHRVIHSNGQLAPEYVFGGQARQREMLIDEGVSFKPNGTVELKKSLWRE